MQHYSHSFHDFALQWLEVYKKHSGIRGNTYNESYLKTVDNFLIPKFGNSNINKITPMEIRMYINELGQSYSKSTVSKVLLCLNQIYAVAIENGICSINPAANVSAHSEVHSEKKRTYTHAEVEEVIAFSATHEYGLYIHMLLELGLRCSELCGLQWDDVDFQNHTIHIRRACTSYKGKAHIDFTKNDSSCRILPISTPLMERLKKEYNKIILDGDKCGNRYIAPSRRNPFRPITPSSFTKGYYNSFFNDYGIEKRIKPHELRHTCGTLLYAKSHDIYAVSKFMGHSSIVITTKLYVHPDPEMLRNALGIK